MMKKILAMFAAVVLLFGTSSCDLIFGDSENPVSQDYRVDE